MSNWLNKRNIIIGVIAIIVISGGYYAYRYFFAPHGGGMMGGAPVSVAEVIEREVQQWQEFSGRLVAVDSAEVRPQVSGIIEKIHFQEGEKVEKGQLLFTIDQRPYLAALEAAQARFTLADNEWQRAKGLLAQKVISEKEYDQRNNALEIAKADLTRAQLDYDYTLIKAPVSGRVSRAEITAGNLISAMNAPVLTTVVSNRPIYADFNIDEQTALQYLQAVGSETEKLKNIPVNLALSGEDGAPHTGRVQSFDNQLDPGTGTIRVRAIFDNENGTLIPGLFARVWIGSAGSTKAMLITDRAIGTDQTKKFVLVVGNDNKVEHREISMGGMVDGLRIVRSGLKAGEKIVVNGFQRAMYGIPIMPELVPMDAKEAPQQAATSGKAAQEAP